MGRKHVSITIAKNSLCKVYILFQKIIVPVGEFLSSPREMMLNVSIFLLEALVQFLEILILLDSTWIDIIILGIYRTLLINIIIFSSTYFKESVTFPTSANMWAYTSLYGWKGSRINWEFPSNFEYSYISVLCRCTQIVTSLSCP